MVRRVVPVDRLVVGGVSPVVESGVTSRYFSGRLTVFEPTSRYAPVEEATIVVDGQPVRYKRRRRAA